MSNVSNQEVGKKVASLLLEIEAIKLSIDNPFKWSSGWNSPIYCDNRLSLSYPQVRDYVKSALSNLVREKFDNVEAIAGVATAGIPQGALVADALDIPFIYVRSKPKGHGMENLIEGRALEGQKVVVLEDLVSTGGSSLNAVNALKSANLQVLGMVAIFTYGFPLATENFTASGVILHCLSDYEHLLSEALDRDYISNDQLTSLKKWRESPETWSN